MLESPDSWADRAKLSQIQKEAKALEVVVSPLDEISDQLSYLAEVAALDDPELLPQACSQLDAIQGRLDALAASAARGPDDHKPAFLTITAGSGGREACNWAEMLLRMYSKMASKRGLVATLIDIVYHDPDGINVATIKFDGPMAYGKVRWEVGVHRLSRVSPFDQADRRQTSFAAVEVTPEAPPEAEFALDPKELDVYYTCGTGPGGQAINKTEVVAVVKHIPTGIIVRSQECRSQQQNKVVALGILTSKLIKLRDEEREAQARGQKKAVKQAAFGGQALRSYVLSQHPAVHDHRSGRSTMRVGDVMDGDLDDLV